ncbi:MAG TPA: helix-turn-helix domain-containing protein [Alphaproteobacteria bacterium]
MDSKRRPRSPGYDAFRCSCPSHTVLDVLANKWAHLVICALRSDTVRFGELARRLEGITPKMLTHTLRLLERDGLVHREVYPVIPPRVDYQLTKLGQDLVGLLDAILRWSERHVPEILKARDAASRAGGKLMAPAPSPPRRRNVPLA